MKFVISSPESFPPLESYDEDAALSWWPMDIIWNGLGMKLTRRQISAAFQQFSLPLMLHETYLFKGIQGAVYLAITERPPDREDVVESITNLKRIISATDKVIDNLNTLHNETACQFSEAELDEYWAGGRVHPNKGRAPFPGRLERLDDEMRWFRQESQNILRSISEIKNPPRWRQLALRGRRIILARACIPVFEKCFGKTAAINRWNRENGRQKNDHWIEFFSIVNSIAFDEAIAPDLDGVLDEARRLHIAQGPIFDPLLDPSILLS